MIFFFLIYKVLIDIQTPGSQFDFISYYMVIEHCQYNHMIPISALLGLSVAKIHMVI